MKLIGKILLAAIAYALGTMLTGIITGALHLPMPDLPPGTTTSSLLAGMVIATPLLIAALLPLAQGLRGTWARRWLAIAVLLFIALGVNTILEAVAFTTMFAKAGYWNIVHYILPSAFVAAALTMPVRSRAGESKLMRDVGAAGWVWRLAVAWLAFPVIYFLFGMCVAPIVVPYYNAGVAGLRIPAMDIIVRTVLIRSALFLVASLPAVFLWTKSRTSLFFALGVAHTVMVGVYGLIQATWFPPVLRVAHSIEITADSFAYAAVLVLLFTRKAKAAQPEVVRAAVAGAN